MSRVDRIQASGRISIPVVREGENCVQVMTQLAFKSQCREAFELYEKVLGGKVSVMNTFGESDARPS